VAQIYERWEGSMKVAIAIAVFVLGVTSAVAQWGTGSNPNSHTVRPHVTSQGTYVGGHQATNPNTTQTDNYGTKGNVNPYTGAVGTRNPRF
jgi:hypothetical protein